MKDNLEMIRDAVNKGYDAGYLDALNMIKESIKTIGRSEAIIKLIDMLEKAIKERSLTESRKG